jgi:putative transposase
LEDITEKMPDVKKIMGEKAYRGTFAVAIENLSLVFEVPDRPEGVKGFAIEAKRWVVERTLACLNFYRRAIMDYGRTTQIEIYFLFLVNTSIVVWLIYLSAA